ncbi:MAG: recombinase RecA, partial [Myxococcaceae bacterium]|nr:recombinase RecA [Myxococcaceae bacterium]
MGAAAERTEGTAEVLEQLRERIRKLQAAPRAYLATLRTGVAPFDALLPGRGLPLGSAVELCGEAASGR